MTEQADRCTEADRFPLGYRQRILFADVDVAAHLNNGALGRYFEEGRAEINRSVFGPRSDTDAAAPQLMLVRLTLEYLAQGRYPGEVEIRTGFRHTGRSSLDYRQAVFQDGNCLAVAESVMVKTVGGRSVPLSDSEQETAARLRVGQ